MNVEQIIKLANGEMVKPFVHTENVISISDNSFIVELFHFKDCNNDNMYSVFDGFNDLEEALKYCSKITPENEHRMVLQMLADRSKGLD